MNTIILLWGILITDIGFTHIIRDWVNRTKDTEPEKRMRILQVAIWYNRISIVVLSICFVLFIWIILFKL